MPDFDGQLAVQPQHAVLAVQRHQVARPDQMEQVLQLFAARVAADSARADRSLW